MLYNLEFVIPKRVGEKSKGNLSSFITLGGDEKPWVIRGMEDGMSIPIIFYLYCIL